MSPLLIEFLVAHNRAKFLSAVPRPRCRRETSHCFPAYNVLNKQIPLSSSSHESTRPGEETYRGWIDLSSLACIGAGCQDGFVGRWRCFIFHIRALICPRFFSVHGLYSWVSWIATRLGRVIRQGRACATGSNTMGR